MAINTLEELKRIVEEDLSCKNAKHIRFINVEKMDAWVKVKDFITSLCPTENHVVLSQYCNDADLTPKTMRLMSDMKRISANTIVMPLSEHIRINNSVAEDLINKIIDLDYNLENAASEFRIYFPMYRMKSVLQKIVGNDQRLKDSVWFLDLDDTDDDYSLTILPQGYATKIKGNNLYGYREYLSYWEDNPCKPIILHTNNAAYYKGNIYNDNVTVLTSAYDILQYHNIVSSTFDENLGSEDSWVAILKNIGTTTNLTAYLKKYFGVGSFNSDEIFSRFLLENTDFGKWLAWLWLKVENTPAYMKHCVTKSDLPQELVIEILQGIFDFALNNVGFWNIYHERKTLMSKMKMHLLPTTFWDKWNILSANKSICYLTDVTIEEKAKIIKNYSEITKIKDGNIILQNIYPDLYAYLSEYSTGILQVDKYFSSYRKGKVLNELPDGFVDIVNEVGTERGIWWKLGLKSRNSVVDTAYNEKSYIFFLDAFGAEFLPFAIYLLNVEHGSLYYDAKMAFAELPTITECNKEFVANRNADPRIDALDKTVHFGIYPNYIAEQLQIIRETLIRAIQKLDNYERVIITADHGASRGVVIAKGESKKVFEGAGVQSDGRYCIHADNVYENDFLYSIDKGYYHVMTNYDRFSISGAAKNENHGGATLEEVLVSAIIISRKPLYTKIVIIEFDTNIKPVNGIAHVTFRIDAVPQSIVAMVNGERCTCVKENGRYSFDAKVDLATEYTAQIIINEQINTFKYAILKGILNKMDL